jgi:hypothetical protein
VFEHGLAVLKTVSHPNASGCKPGRMLSDALTMRKFDVKKNYLITKDLVGMNYKNPNIILLQRHYGLINSGFLKKQFMTS